MPDLLLKHGYFVYEDPNELQIMKLYAPLGILYLCSYLRQKGFDSERLFHSTYSHPSSGRLSAATHRSQRRAICSMRSAIYMQRSASTRPRSTTWSPPAPAEIFLLQDGQGRIEEFGVADLIAIRSQHNTTARALSELTFTEVELVLLAGLVQMASPHLYAPLPHDFRSGMELIEVAGHATLDSLAHAGPLRNCGERSRPEQTAAQGKGGALYRAL